MAHTVKWEHRTDGYHIGHRLERQARPAGRIVALVEAELDPGEVEPFDLCFEPVEDLTDVPDMAWGAIGDEPIHTYMPCGGWCRRCLLHDDPGGCVG